MSVYSANYASLDNDALLQCYFRIFIKVAMVTSVDRRQLYGKRGITVTSAMSHYF